jgi:hypothetical protein
MAVTVPLIEPSTDDPIPERTEEVEIPNTEITEQDSEF